MSNAQRSAQPQTNAAPATVNVGGQTLTIEQAIAMIAQLKAENEALAKAKSARVTIKLTAKGGISVYGLGRWPVTLYRTQWKTLLGKAQDIEAFIGANAAVLDAHEAARTEDAREEADAQRAAVDPIAAEAARRAADVDARLAVVK